MAAATVTRGAGSHESAPKNDQDDVSEYEPPESNGTPTAAHRTSPPQGSENLHICVLIIEGWFRSGEAEK